MDNPPKKSRGIWVFLAVVILAAGGAVAWQYYGTLIDLDQGGGDKAGVDEKLEQWKQIAKAKGWIADGRYEEALALLRKVKAKTSDPDRNMEIDVNLAHAHAGLGQYDKALALFTGVIEKSDDESKVARAEIGHGTTVTASGEFDRGMQELTDVVDRYAEIVPTFSAEALFARAKLYEKKGQIGKTRAELSRVMDEFPGREGADKDRAYGQVGMLSASLLEQQAEQVAKLRSAGCQSVASIPAGQTVTWTAEQGPYLIEEALVVPGDTVLKIEAGTVLRFGISGGLRVAGRVEATGTAEKPIRCLPVHEDPAATWWPGFRFEVADGTAPSHLTHVEFVSAESAISATRGEVAVTECDIRQPVQYGLHSESGGNIVAKQCRIVGGAYEGIRCENGGTISAEGGRVAEHAMSGVTVRTTVSFSLRGCTVEKNGRTGIAFRDGGAGQVEKCRIIANATTGLLCRGDASPQLAGCEIAQNGADGINCQDRSKPVLASTQVQQNKGTGVRLDSSSDAKISGCQVRDNEQHGIWCRLSSPEILTSVIAGNAEVGIWIVEGGQPRLNKSSVVENKGPALRNHTSNVINATENWWGSSDLAQIGERIEDREDKDEWGSVKIDPVLEAPPSGTTN